MTIAIASFQRRDELRVLLESVASNLDALASTDVDVLVVIDGSTDGSVELVEELAESFPVPLRSLWQENSGLAAARECGDRSRDGRRRVAVGRRHDDLVGSARTTPPPRPI